MFKTPAYWNVATESPVKVHLELRRKSDQETSEPVEFTYEPQMFGSEPVNLWSSLMNHRCLVCGSD